MGGEGSAAVCGGVQQRVHPNHLILGMRRDCYGDTIRIQLTNFFFQMSTSHRRDQRHEVSSNCSSTRCVFAALCAGRHHNEYEKSEFPQRQAYGNYSTGI